MLVPFKDLSDSSRLWIYQCNRSFSELELQDISNQISEFLTSWTAHGADLQAGFEIKYKRFIVIALDQNKNHATGCSIDASVHFIQGLQTQYNIDLLDKLNVSYKQGEFIAYKTLKDFKKWPKTGLCLPKQWCLIIWCKPKRSFWSFGKYQLQKVGMLVYFNL